MKIIKLAQSSHSNRFLFFLFSDVLLITFSLYLSFFFHLDFNLNINYTSLILEVLPFFIIVKLIALVVFKGYSFTWRYVGIYDLVNLILAMVVSGMALIILSIPTTTIPFHLSITGFPKRILFADGVISLFLISALRISKRLYLEVIYKRPAKRGKATIILGAGNTGEMILRDMIRQGFSEFNPVGFLDDDRVKVGTYIHRVKVLDTLDALRDVILRYGAQAIIVAIPTLNHKTLRKIYDLARALKVSTIKIVPRIYDFTKPDINLKGLEDISIEDIIGRQVVAVDYEGIKGFLKGKVVLITGAGGSIGSELAIQVGAFQPETLILFDIDDTDLHNMHLKIKRIYPQLFKNVHFVIGDVRDEGRVNEVFETFHPSIVFHAAAYKHVPMMEHNPKEAVKVNMFGTYILSQVSARYSVEKFVMISTDKAVKPTSVMGATKRMAEYICQAFNGSGEQRAEGASNPSTLKPFNSSTRFVSVRFGNVLGSRGSVLPLFMEQLKYGGPLTVTHEEMKRYFMTIPEAVSLVLQASYMGNGGEVFVLDMGEPLRIVEMAEELIRIHGLEPYKDIDIDFIGLRPGEKLFEEILTAEEGTVASKHERVYIARKDEKYSTIEIDNILREFELLLAESSTGNESKVKALLKKYVKHYEEN